MTEPSLPRSVISDAIPQGFIPFHDRVINVIKMNETYDEQAVSTELFHLREKFLTFMELGGMMSTNCRTVVIGLENVKIDSILRLAIEDVFLCTWEQQDIRSLTTEEVILNAKPQVNFCFCHQGLNKKIKPNIFTGVRANGVRGIDNYWGAFLIDLPEGGYVLHPNNPDNFFSWLVNYSESRLLALFPEIFSQLNEHKISRIGTPRKFIASILYDICMENGSIDPNRLWTPVEIANGK